jgi:putative membrane protein insertion efficiency factor
MQFNHPPTKAELLMSYQEQCCDDPTSVYYNRVLVRPKIPTVKAVLCILGTAALSVGLGMLIKTLSDSTLACVLTSVAVVIALIALHAKRIAIFCVRLYQRLAPERLRRRCRYEPSCSQYMIASLEKYGFFKGLRKGLARWHSCKPPNGGFDPLK